ncbi:TVA2 protein, partial [Amia calva]|nr:TVA2 protein [Amia calva]
EAQVTQNPVLLTVTEGATVTIDCSYIDSSVTVMQWYRQHPNKPPENLVITAGPTVTKNQSSSSLNRSNKSGVFNIRGSQRADSATYYCAVEAQCKKAEGGADKNTVDELNSYSFKMHNLLSNAHFNWLENI